MPSSEFINLRRALELVKHHRPGVTDAEQWNTLVRACASDRGPSSSGQVERGDRIKLESQHWRRAALPDAGDLDGSMMRIKGSAGPVTHLGPMMVTSDERWNRQWRDFNTEHKGFQAYEVEIEHERLQSWLQEFYPIASAARSTHGAGKRRNADIDRIWVLVVELFTAGGCTPPGHGAVSAFIRTLEQKALVTGWRTDTKEWEKLLYPCFAAAHLVRDGKNPVAAINAERKKTRPLDVVWHIVIVLLTARRAVPTARKADEFVEEVATTARDLGIPFNTADRGDELRACLDSARSASR
jgi:hypothetical protein